jgi:isoaspartyl peptidase/L-asparaginase-like protein (Ntn-hydrolase superfamily)
MPDPLILSTWTFGQRANEAAWPILASNGSSLDAVEAACKDAELDPSNHTVGLAGYPDRDGHVTLDASIMLSPSQCGSVCALKGYVHAISVARRVMEKTNHVLLAGEGAALFAREQGFKHQDLLTLQSKSAWEQWRNAKPQAAKSRAGSEIRNVEDLGLSDRDRTHDTIGVLAIDVHHVLAGACSTSGMRFKLPGRVGDSPIIGHALYVDPDVGAAVTTGHGELVMGVCGAFLAVESMRRGASPLDAAVDVVTRISKSYKLTDQDQVGIIVLNRGGEWRGGSLREGFRVAVKTAARDELVEPDHVMLRG